ncbi:hypothetical protein GY45DRAFT_1318270 [Cubamyces sp. BRFM 1775]|nr:hypothetical protein GY45DRAFT_1318270 [Cubamyces sp. BRFM 1775]
MAAQLPARSPEPRFTPSIDDALFEHYKVVDDRKTGPQNVFLARIFHESTSIGVPTLHWALVWPAYHLTPDKELQQGGWHMVDIQKKTSEPGAALGFRHQFKGNASVTTKVWDLDLLAENVPVNVRTVLMGYSEGWNGDAGGNCITCICDVVKELALVDGFLPHSAVTVMQEARKAEMKDERRRPYHEASAW